MGRRPASGHDVGMTPTDTVLSVRHLSKRYGAATVVDDLSFSIPRGDVVGLIGPNGAGKTTVMKSLVGLVRPSGGDLDVLGVSVGAAGWGQVLTRVGTMIEAPPLYGRMTARQNLRYQSMALGHRPDETRIDEILALVGLADEADMRPRKFSLGMKQRLGIGITLIGDPELIILDEPANGLDPAGILEIRGLLRRLPEMGTTVLVSSHQLGEVQQACDSLLILDRGRLITAGTTQDIVESRAEHAFEIEMSPADVEVAVALLREQGFAVRSDAALITVHPDASVAGRDLLRLLTGAGLYPDALAPQAVSLEQAFLDLTPAR